MRSADEEGSEDAVLAETLAALEMPRGGLRKWFERSREFCARHGGERHYGELMALYRECLAALEEGE